jgi:RNA polymerase sigma-70 factor (ECF subfamily)
MEVEARRRFEELALPHLAPLYRFALRLTGNPAVAEELVQETFLKALESFATLRDPERAKPWLFRILSRLAIDRGRKEARDVTVQVTEDLDRFSLYDLVWQEDPLPYSDRLHEDFLAQFRDEEVRAALLALPAAYLAPLMLVHLEGMTYKELAEVLDIPMGTVMSRLHRGRKILERELWEYAKRRGLVKTWEKPNA